MLKSPERPEEEFDEELEEELEELLMRLPMTEAALPNEEFEDEDPVRPDMAEPRRSEAMPLSSAPEGFFAPALIE